MNTMATHVSKYRKTRAQTGSAGIIIPKVYPAARTIARAYINSYHATIHMNPGITQFK